jgi:hypothetical protein
MYIYMCVCLFIYLCLCIYIYTICPFEQTAHTRGYFPVMWIPWLFLAAGFQWTFDVWNFFNDMCICPFGSSGPSHWALWNSRESTNQSNEFKWNWTSYHFVITSIIELNGCRWEIQRKMEDPKKRDRLPADLQTAPGPFGVNITLRQHNCEQICF